MRVTTRIFRHPAPGLSARLGVKIEDIAPDVPDFDKAVIIRSDNIVQGRLSREQIEALVDWYSRAVWEHFQIIMEEIIRTRRRPPPVLVPIRQREERQEPVLEQIREIRLEEFVPDREAPDIQLRRIDPVPPPLFNQDIILDAVVPEMEVLDMEQNEQP